MSEANEYEASVTAQGVVGLVITSATAKALMNGCLPNVSGQMFDVKYNLKHPVGPADWAAGPLLVV